MLYFFLENQCCISTPSDVYVLYLLFTNSPLWWMNILLFCSDAWVYCLLMLYLIYSFTCIYSHRYIPRQRWKPVLLQQQQQKSSIYMFERIYSFERRVIYARKKNGNIYSFKNCTIYEFLRKVVYTLKKWSVCTPYKGHDQESENLHVVKEVYTLLFYMGI